MIELQVELNSWKERGRKLSHVNITCIEILKNNVYYPHIRPREYVDFLTHVTVSFMPKIWI
jgi:hypothetical protein